MNEAHEDVLPMQLIDEPVRPSRDTMDPERLGALADDIAANGLLQKPGVRGPFPDGRYELIWGHRRLLALRLLRWPELPCMVYPASYDPDVARVAENLQREELNPIEEGQECQRFIDKGMPRAAIARLFRRTPAWVDGRLTLLHYPPDVQEAVRAGQVSIGVAGVLAQIDHDIVRADFLKEAVRTGAKTLTAETWLYHYRADRDRIITNVLTVEQFGAERESWVIMVPCQLCEENTDYQHTRSLRLCRECLAAIPEALSLFITKHRGGPAAR
jgi:ParB/RepB/Spo0J family partition protein